MLMRAVVILLAVFVVALIFRALFYGRGRS